MGGTIHARVNRSAQQNQVARPHPKSDEIRSAGRGSCMSFGIYAIGFAILIGGLTYGAHGMQI
jgi:hypothetical protein